jgi:hypothetical protein
MVDPTNAKKDLDPLPSSPPLPAAPKGTEPMPPPPRGEPSTPGASPLACLPPGTPIAKPIQAEDKDPATAQEVKKLAQQLKQMQLTPAFSIEWFKRLEEQLVTDSQAVELKHRVEKGNRHEQFLTKALKDMLNCRVVEPAPIIGKFEIKGIPRTMQGDVVICRRGRLGKREMQLHGVDITQVLAVVEVKTTLTNQLVEVAAQELTALNDTGKPSFLVGYQAGNTKNQQKRSKTSTILGWLSTLPTHTQAVFLFPRTNGLQGRGLVLRRAEGGWEHYETPRCEPDGTVLLALLAILFPHVAAQQADISASVLTLFKEHVRFSRK